VNAQIGIYQLDDNSSLDVSVGMYIKYITTMDVSVGIRPLNQEISGCISWDTSIR
jgi:hypothetical protein